MNQFSSSYAILHDSDTPKSKNGNANPAWTANQRIQDAAQLAPKSAEIKIFASKVNFEQAFLGGDCRTDKPFNAIYGLKTDDSIYEKLKNLLLSLIDFSKSAPEGVIAWTDLAELEKIIEKNK